MLVKPRGRMDQVIADQETLDAIVEKGKGYLASYASSLLTGWIPARPLELKPGQLPCNNCDFGALCRFRADRDPVRREPVEGMPVQPPSIEVRDASPPTGKGRP